MDEFEPGVDSTNKQTTFFFFLFFCHLEFGDCICGHITRDS